MLDDAGSSSGGRVVGLAGRTRRRSPRHHPGGGGAVDVGADHAPLRSGACEPSEVDVQLGRDPARQR